MSIVGQFDQNLKELEKLTNTVIFFRGNSITCKGKESNLKDFSEAIKFLIGKYLLTNFIEKSDIMLSVKKDKDMKSIFLEVESSRGKTDFVLLKEVLY